MRILSGCCLVVAHDAGGAEILLSYVQQNKQNYVFVLEGAAAKIFQLSLPDIQRLSLEQGIEKASWLLCGTSWQSDIEWQAIKLAKEKALPVVSFIDHWVNYRDRFIHKGEQHLPDEIWVGDKYAEMVAKNTFADTAIKMVENPYLIDVEKEFNRLKQNHTKQTGKKTVLFLSENLSGHALLKYGDKNYFGYTELDAISFLLNNLDCLAHDIEKVIIRAHPSDHEGKYDHFINQYVDKVEMSDGSSLLNNILQSDIVAGCETMALVVALKVGRKVVSCIPTDQACRLPHEEILNLKMMIDKKRK